MLAVIKTWGKQYLVFPGNKIKIEKIEKKEGQEVTFNDVLLLAYSPSGPARLGEKDRKLEIGTPKVKGVKIVGKVLKQGKGKKIVVFKYKSKKRYKKKQGHRQPFTEIEITKMTPKVSP